MQRPALTLDDSLREIAWPVVGYDLAATLTSGQAFRWQLSDDEWWHGVVNSHWVRLRCSAQQMLAQTVSPVGNWHWLAHYLQINLDLSQVLASFPDDEPMSASAAACHGLRLLRQDPWECLASFILSSTKQIVQIKQIISLLCERFGASVPVLPSYPQAYSFPSAARLSVCSEAELRSCKMGFRAPYLRAVAQMIAQREIDFDHFGTCEMNEARQVLLRLPGVGRKIADCVLLFAFGFQEAFPVDVWIMKALRQLYFPGRRMSRTQLEEFTASHFGSFAGYAQQYLFHYMRTSAKSRPVAPSRRENVEFLKPGSA